MLLDGYDVQLIKKLDIAFRVGIVFLILFATIVLIGWSIDFPIFRNPIQGQTPVGPTTAFGFLFAAISVGALHCAPKTKWANILAGFCACIMIGFSMCFLGYYFAGWPDYEQLILAGHLAQPDRFAPGRMASSAAVLFLLVGLCLILFDVRSRLGFHPVQWLCILICVMSLVNLVGSLYGISLFYGITKYAQIPLPSSFAFIVLSLSMLFTRPTYGVMNIFTNNTCGGFMARRLLPSAIIIPITIGWINTYGQKLGLYRWEFGVPVLVVAMIVACCLLIATTSQALQKLDEARQSFAREREDLALQRENFMAVITHDLKNPLIGAERIFLLFLQGALGDVTPEQTKIILALKKSNDQLLAMVRNLLQLYRYDQGTQTLQFENIDLLRTLRLSMSELLSMSESHRVTIELKTPEALPLANVDSVAMGHVFSNLLQNAIKFSPEGSKVVISVNTGEDLLVFKFRDSGPGISPGEQEKLFRRFSQGHLGRANKTGTGLGLYLCCQIMRQHGGSLTLLSSELGSGSTFAMALPIAFSRLGNPRSCS